MNQLNEYCIHSFTTKYIERMKVTEGIPLRGPECPLKIRALSGAVVDVNAPTGVVFILVHSIRRRTRQSSSARSSPGRLGVWDEQLIAGRDVRTASFPPTTPARLSPLLRPYAPTHCQAAPQSYHGTYRTRPARFRHVPYPTKRTYQTSSFLLTSLLFP